MKLVPVSNLFQVNYGVNLELNKLTQDSTGVPFVSRTAKNNGVSARVRLLPGKSLNPAGTISVAGGGSVMESFLQKEPYYSGRDLYYLVPKTKMSDNVLLFYCACLRANKYKFNYGRQANRTLKDLLVPDINFIPKYVDSIDLNEFDDLSEPFSLHKKELTLKNWKKFSFEYLFDIDRGRGPRKKDLTGTGNTIFVSASIENNGVTGITSHEPIHKGGVISVVRNGNSVASAYYQEKSFCSTEDVHIFTPKFTLNKYIALFLCTLIRREKYRFNYGRKWSIARMYKSEILLPAKKNGAPDYDFMEGYIKTLDYSKKI